MTNNQMMPNVIGLDVGGTKVLAARVTRAGRVEKAVQVQTPQNRTGFFNTAERLVRTLQNNQTIAVGMGLPGALEANGRVKSMRNVPCLIGTRPAWILSTRIGLPAFSLNDARAFAIAENAQGPAKNVRNAVFLTLGTGVGGESKRNGRWPERATSWRTEISHIPLLDDDRIGPRGIRGEIEAYVSGWGIRKTFAEERAAPTARTNLKSNATPKEIFDAATRKDTVGQRVVARTGAYLGECVRALARKYKPNIIVLGGGIAVHWPALRRHAGRLPCKVVVSKVQSAGAVGAALWALKRAE